MRDVRDDQSADVKEEPLSEVMCKGTPNLDIHVDSRALAQSAAVADFIGTASGHLVARSTMVKRYLKSSDGGRGPTTSTWMWENLLVGTGK